MLANSSNFGGAAQESKSKIDRSQSLRDVHPRRYKYDSSFFLNRSNNNNNNSNATSQEKINIPNPKIASTATGGVGASSQNFDYQSYVDSLIVLPKKSKSESIISSIISEKKLDGLKKDLEQVKEENQELKKYEF
jgi:hypothetical protein